MEFSIRPACLQDAALLPVIEKSAAQLFKTESGLEWLADSDTLSESILICLISLGTVWIAQTEAGQVIGFICTEEFDEELHIWELSVHADFQRKGIGKRLIQEAYKHASSLGLSALTLTTFSDVSWNAPWYAQLGFQIVSTSAEQRLRQLLDAEVKHGLPASRQVAMRLSVAAAIK
jgi:ribosomal protein S18 acetylase RimI-like enzyme